ncbi:bifunctional diguanylate cyclase/phosphodiesterase [Jannaschia sp. S6380]|uniref:bifunctional diguanylate cyclase/phosphodiesterase n=1 Tax=Jannaschia sp. S6380 TaxID=2926408 RepID=UPI001FF446AF|nr:bifunctional diguanylate cyclase/phosphodiesterase [Jannaschia sp. S6380]MCK0169350.1 bifunctional diguanylate cyclase/phosphodiesterase [Jannaschia sp. S6380]
MPNPPAPRRAAWPPRIDWALLFPAMAGLAWVCGQDAVAVTLMMVFPLLLVLDGRLGWRGVRASQAGDTVSVRPLARGPIHDIIDGVLRECSRQDRTTAVLHVVVDDLHVADGAWDTDIGEAVMTRLVPRVAAVLRTPDAVLRQGEDGLVIVLAPTRRADLDVVMAIVDRIQTAVAEPVLVDGCSVRVHACVGICNEGMAPARTGAAMLAAADCALRLARRQGAEAVRVFTPDIQTRVETDHRLSAQVEDALIEGQFRPWFQPQVDARTGRLAGFEALARWHHPTLGVLTPGQFLPAIAAAARCAELGEHILRASLEALVAWDRAGLEVPCVGVNLSLEELADPRLSDRIIWQLDRYDIRPERLAIEILETVTLRGDDEAIMRNVTMLRRAGFRLDLDDFGTGAASIAHIARFGVHRIKIDQSFVTGIDADATQREIVAAILGLAERLGIETLAEGVETVAERAALVALGCPQLQGYGIARPMPLSDTIPWARGRRAGDIESRALPAVSVTTADPRPRNCAPGEGAGHAGKSGSGPCKA